jgi:phosphatidylserine/phosphatidylglycerophosphate/cardiolipin synthase-like enzyme/uncharacterized membrane protein YdjX (TVP38/TMEM64 family)
VREGILVEGRNCWRRRTAKRVSFLIDGAAYFEAFAQSVEVARNSILIAGWDINSQIELLRGDQSRNSSTRLGDFLNTVVSRVPGLRIYILAWDFAMIYALEREPFPIFKLDWRTHGRLHFRLDGDHPVGASHHQKIVVVDDAIAFVGGLDLTKHRWDTSEHRVNEPRRVDPHGHPYPPFHDVQMLVGGEVARSLGDLFRRRWEHATGKELEAPEPEGNDPWPPGIEPDLTDVSVAISRTEPAHRGRPEVREVETLYLDAICSAEKSIYIENQYLTSSTIGDALAACLGEEVGPEVVLVLRRKGSGWLEEQTMDELRIGLFNRLHAADRHGRLRVYYPFLPGLGDEFINLHAKVLIVDDHLVRIGSSNITNRSMGLDTECDLAIEASGEDRAEETIALLRNRLMGEHLGVPPERVGERMVSTNSLIETVETLRGSGRTLLAFGEEREERPYALLSDSALVDPERPVGPEQLAQEFIPDEARESGSQRVGRTVIVFLVLIGLAVAWRFTPLADWLDVNSLARWAQSIRANPATPLMVIAAFMLGGLVVFPVTLLIGATAMVFDPLVSIVYAFLGSLSSAVLTYAIGQRLGRETVRRVAGGRLNRLSKRLAKRGFITVAAVRLLPVAPYSIVNVVAGASHIRLSDFVLGTISGLAPGILAIAVFADQVKEILRDPRLENFAIMAALAVLAVVAIVWIQRHLSRRTNHE